MVDRMTAQDPVPTLQRRASRKQIFLFRRGGLADLHQRYTCLHEVVGGQDSVSDKNCCIVTDKEVSM